MHHSCVDCGCDRKCHLLRIEDSVQHLTTGTDISLNMVDIRKSLIAHMMVDADSLLSFFKKVTRKCQTVSGTDIAGNKEVKYSVICLCFYFIDTFNMSEDRLRMIKINGHINIRKICSDIQVQRHTGADTVAIRTDMSANPDSFYTFQYFCYIFHGHSSYSSSDFPKEASLFATSSINFDIFTPYSIDSSRIKRISGVLRRFRFLAS